jgi:hypothetical protein
VGGDIFLGMHDDDNYVANLQEVSRLKNADDQDAESIRIRAEFQQTYDNELKTMTESQSEYEAKALYSMMRRKLDARKGSPIINVQKLSENLDAHYKETIDAFNAKKEEGQK